MTSPLCSRDIALAGGYTAGHIMPMIAVGEAYAECSPGARIIALGQTCGLEARLMAERGFAIHGLDAAPVFGATTPRGLAAAARASWRGFRQARQILADAGTQVVIAFGGYVTGGPVLAARSLGIPVCIFEANVIPGLANRLLRPLADCCLIGQAETRSFRGWAGADVVGHPIRRELAGLATVPRSGSGALQVFVTGGSLGSFFIDSVAPGLIARLAVERQVHVLHQCGPDCVQTVNAAYAAAGISAEVRSFLDMQAAYARADLVICAAGAGTLAEIEFLGLRALSVPIEAAADGHQVANAAAFAKRTGLPIMRESEWNEAEAAHVLIRLLGKPRSQTEFHAGVSPALRIVETCEKLLTVRRSPARLMQVPSRPTQSARS